MLNSIQSSSGINVTASKPADLVTSLLPYVFGAAGIVLVFNIINSGLKLMTSRGDPKATQTAQATITSSVIGILILTLSFVIVEFILNFLGINVNIF